MKKKYKSPIEERIKLENKIYDTQESIEIREGEGVYIRGTSQDMKRALTFIFDKIERQDEMLWSWIQWRTQIKDTP